MLMILVIAAGLVIGSLLNIVIIRLPRERRLLGWPPHCTRTGEPLALWQLLPILGWVLQRGRAPDGQLLPWIAPLVELLSATALALLYRQYGFSLLFFYLGFVCLVLLVTGAIDWTHRFIYVFVILGGTGGVLLVNLLAGGSLPALPLRDSVEGALVAGVAFILLFLLAKVLFPSRAVPFGMGDVYLGIFLGAAFGRGHLMPALTYGVMMAGVVAAIILILKHGFGRRDVPEYMPYGSYLCLGAIIYLMVQEWA
ncbi:MAG: prepilin peptidase [Chloroflexaceae bacterium]|nr:prepilin peptidase [Chloroflexaceae bacterium]